MATRGNELVVRYLQTVDVSPKRAREHDLRYLKIDHRYRSGATL